MGICEPTGRVQEGGWLVQSGKAVGKEGGVKKGEEEGKVSCEKVFLSFSQSDLGFSLTPLTRVFSFGSLLLAE